MKNDYVTKKDLKDTVDQAVMDIISAISKTLINFATKNDLKKFATKDDLKNLATKNDLVGVEHRLDAQIKDLKRDINDLKADTPTPQEFQKHGERILRLENAVFP